ncbi:MAG: IgGFc-binding protein, partial [Flavobacteriales bacterium]
MAQFDTKFYMPPIWDAQANNLNQPSELFITTPFPDDVNVHVQTADGVTFVFDGVVSSGNPLAIPLTTAVGQTTVQNAVLETGLIITSDKPVQASHRVAATNNQTLITLKGENGKGQDFWCGSQVRNLNQNYFPEEYHFISVMATENNTTITIDTPFAMFANGGGNLSNPVVIQLNKDDSYLIRGHDPTEHVAGAHVTSDKDILVTSGSTHTRISGAGATSADGGTDQLVPVDLMGNSFVVVRGDNDPTYDYAIIVATEDGTEVTVDGIGPPTLLNAGEYFDYTLTGSMGTPHYISTTGISYCYHVSGASQNQEVGMSCMPQLECTGSRYIENSRLPANAQTQVMTFVVPPEAEPTFTINGDLYSTVAGVTSQAVPGLTDWIAVTVPNGSMLQNNVYESEGFFHAGFLTGDNGATGTFGYLSGFDDAFEFIDPNEDLPTTVYVADSLCQGEQSLHCLQVYSCADDHNIIDFEGNEGEIIVTPGVPGFAFDTCFQYTAPFNFTGNDTITFTVDNRFGFEGSIDVVFFVVDPSTPIDAGPTQQLCSETTGTLSAIDPDPLVDGYWVVIGSGPQITDPNSPTTVVTDLNVGTNTFIWTQEYGCSTRTDITQINVFVGEPPVADAGEDVHLCNSNNSYV